MFKLKVKSNAPDAIEIFDFTFQPGTEVEIEVNSPQEKLSLVSIMALEVIDITDVPVAPLEDKNNVEVDGGNVGEVE